MKAYKMKKLRAQNEIFKQELTGLRDSLNKVLYKQEGSTSNRAYLRDFQALRTSHDSGLGMKNDSNFNEQIRNFGSDLTPEQLYSHEKTLNSGQFSNRYDQEYERSPHRKCNPRNSQQRNDQLRGSNNLSNLAINSARYGRNEGADIDQLLQGFKRNNQIDSNKLRDVR